MELKQLKRFLAVVDEGSLAAAARHLGMTQQAISASIAGLEKGLAVRLLDRAPGGITRLTEHGSALLPHARSQVAADRRARNALSAVTEAETGTVSIGIGESFAGDVVADAVTSLHQSRPKLRINIVEGYSEMLIERFYRGEFDFLTVGVSNVSLRDGYHAEVIYAANDVIACRPGHPLLAKKNLKLSDLQGYGWLVPYSRPSDLDVINETFIAKGYAPPASIIGTDAYRVGMKVQTRTDLLMMTSPALVKNSFAKQTYGIQVLPIDEPTVRRNASLVLNGNRPLTAAGSALLENIRASVRDLNTVDGFSQP